jgi:type IV secretion system protein VirD4
LIHCSVREAPGHPRLLDGLSAGMALLDTSPRIRRRHVWRAHRLLSWELPNGELDALEAMTAAFSEGGRPLPWTAPARALRYELPDDEPPWFQQGLGHDAYAWAAPDLLSVAELQAGVAPGLCLPIGQVCNALQGIALADKVGVVLPRHFIRLKVHIDSRPPASDRRVAEWITEGILEGRANRPGLRLHRSTLPLIKGLVEDLHEHRTRLPLAPRGEVLDLVRKLASATTPEPKTSSVWEPTPELSALASTRHPVFDGLLLGWTGNRIASAGSRRAAEPVLHRGEGHLITIAPTGAGKGVGAVIPALLSHPGSVVVIDPKGENFAVTARLRREMGQQVHVIDPFGITGPRTDRLNPMDLLANSEDATWEEAAMITELLVPRHVRVTRNAWWYERAHELLAGTFLLASTDPRRREGGLGGWLSYFELSPPDLRAKGRVLLDDANPDLRMAATSFLTGSIECFNSSVMMAQGIVGGLSSPAVARACNGPSSISLKDLAAGVPMTIYLVLPPAQLRAQGGLLRLWMGLLLHAALGRRVAPADRTLFLVDEAAQLGPLSALTTAMTLARGYGVSVWTFWQDLAQLKATYPTLWRTLLHNCAVHQVFGVPNEATAMALAELHGMSDHRDLLAKGSDTVLLTHAGRVATEVRRGNYLRDAAFAGRFDPNPLHGGAPAPHPVSRNVSPLRAIS